MRYSEIITRDRIEYEARRLAYRYGMNPLEINNGWCFAYASSLADIVGNGAKVVGTTGYDGVYPGHSVVLYRGRYYDAENPEGVANMVELRYNKRMQGVLKGDPEAIAQHDSIPREYDPRNPY